MTRQPSIFSTIVLFSLLCSCSLQRHISRQANTALWSNPELKAAHVGIAVYDVDRQSFFYSYQPDKYFIPASNTKLFTFYAALKYLGDSITAARYQLLGDTLLLEANGDPTFLHPDFSRQPLFDFLHQPAIKNIKLYTPFADEPLGMGWAWDDYTAGYMAERDPFPMYGNIATFTSTGDTIVTVPQHLPVADIKTAAAQPWTVTRNPGSNWYDIIPRKGTNIAKQNITLSMDKGTYAAGWLSDTIHKSVTAAADRLSSKLPATIYSQPLDSVLKVMMHNSDNFLAEQTLLMVSNERLGVMNDRKIIDTLLRSDLAGLPQKPKWVDGSGLSRYNLCTPNDVVWLLGKIKAENSFNRIKTILPTGDNGTLGGLYKNAAGRIYAKTGTLSNNLALSGYLLTRHNRTLIFSVFINNHQGNTTTLRKNIETFITGIIDKY